MAIGAVRVIAYKLDQLEVISLGISRFLKILIFKFPIFQSLVCLFLGSELIN